MDASQGNSDTSSTHSGSTSDTDVQVVVEPLQQDLAASTAASSQHHARRADVGRAWGPFRITPSKHGYQLTCTHPEHQADSTCTKTRSCNIAGEESALRMLKRWAQLGYECGSKNAHREMWQLVREEALQDQLPEMADLDAWAEEVEF